jgi:hypothetical protein
LKVEISYTNMVVEEQKGHEENKGLNHYLKLS